MEELINQRLATEVLDLYLATDRVLLLDWSYLRQFVLSIYNTT